MLNPLASLARARSLSARLPALAVRRHTVTPAPRAAVGDTAAPASLPVQSWLTADGLGSIVDVRSPCEWRAGHVPGSVNLPLFSDEQRAAVGTCFKQRGRTEAVLLGLHLAGPSLAALSRAALALSAAGGGRPLRLTCFRGGSRSASVAWLLRTLGLEVVLLEGGYKAFRGWCQAQFGPQPGGGPRLVLLTGLTGSGKTAALAALRLRGEAVVDLEGLAGHKGSAFGGVAGTAEEAAAAAAAAEAAAAPGAPPAAAQQPTPEMFENRLALQLFPLQRPGAARRLVWVEDEAPSIGRVFIPRPFYARLLSAPLLLISVPLEERVATLQAGYAAAPAEALCGAAERLRRQLGGARCDEAQALVRAGDTAAAARLLLQHYDAAYSRTLAGKGKPAVRLTLRPERPAAEVAAALAAAAAAAFGGDEPAAGGGRGGGGDAPPQPLALPPWPAADAGAAERLLGDAATLGARRRRDVPAFLFPPQDG